MAKTHKELTTEIDALCSQNARLWAEATAAAEAREREIEALRSQREKLAA